MERKKYREIQGTYPVIFMSFAGIKSNILEMLRMIWLLL